MRLKYAGIAIATNAITSGTTIDIHNVFLEAENKLLGNITHALETSNSLSLFASILVLDRQTSETVIFFNKLPKNNQNGMIVCVLISKVSYIGCKIGSYSVVFMTIFS